MGWVFLGLGEHIQQHSENYQSAHNVAAWLKLQALYGKKAFTQLEAICICVFKPKSQRIFTGVAMCGVLNKLIYFFNNSFFYFVSGMSPGHYTIGVKHLPIWLNVRKGKRLKHNQITIYLRGNYELHFSVYLQTSSEFSGVVYLVCYNFKRMLCLVFYALFKGKVRLSLNCCYVLFSEAVRN